MIFSSLDSSRNNENYVCFFDKKNEDKNVCLEYGYPVSQDGQFRYTKVTFRLMDSENDDNEQKQLQWNEILNFNLYDDSEYHNHSEHFTNIFTHYLANPPIVNTMLDAGLFKLEGDNIVISSSFYYDDSVINDDGFQLRITISSRMHL